MTIEFAQLPYAVDALEPHISARTLEFHYGKHHKGYVAKLNAAISDSDYKDSDYKSLSLEDIVCASREAGDGGVFNNAAQVWNHAFLWNSMTPDQRAPSQQLAHAISDAFDDLDGFRATFRKSALAQFGSGWTWLVASSNGLEILNTGNADTPLSAAGDVTPLLTLDVWEHAYYLDYQNQRNRYIDAFLESLVNWEFASSNFATATQTD